MPQSTKTTALVNGEAREIDLLCDTNPTARLEIKGEEAVKFDEDKVRMELLPPEFLTSTASILTFGAQKYSARNWEQGMDWSRVYGALQRHLNAWWSGEHTDPETGKSHLWHANCCMAFLTTYEMRGVGTDDRPYPREGEGI